MSNGKPENNKKQARQKIPRKISERYLRNSGLFYLQRFTASSGHFKNVMRRKIIKSCHYHKDQDFDECMSFLEKVTDEFIEQGLLDDEAYLRGMVTSLRRSGKSQKAIAAKLRAKAIPADQIETALRTYDENNHDNQNNAEFSAALTLARKKRIGPFATHEKQVSTDPNDQYRMYQKAMGVLARNGFSYDISQRIMNLDRDSLETME